ncbi:hypothetical protein B566_EDAN013229 [Ephemera danica]|nr:hypothetical protein B566_EDAN013229 [Ephemera danica]
MNRRITSFKHQRSDKINKPMTIKEKAKKICAHEISSDQICELQSKISRYITTRARLFPDFPLKPKAHYLRHFTLLILRFGPLINMFTMRCESHNIFFKTIAKNSRNFKCISKTCALKHQ